MAAVNKEIFINKEMISSGLYESTFFKMLQNFQNFEYRIHSFHIKVLLVFSNSNIKTILNVKYILEF